MKQIIKIGLIIISGIIFIPSAFAASTTTSEGLTTIDDCPEIFSITPNDAVGYVMWLGENVSFDDDERSGTCFVEFFDQAPETGRLLMEYNSGNGGYNFLGFATSTMTEPSGYLTACSNGLTGFDCSNEVEALATADGSSANTYWFNGDDWVFPSNLSTGLTRDNAIKEQLDGNFCYNGFKSTWNIYADDDAGFTGDCSSITANELIKQGTHSIGDTSGEEEISWRYPQNGSTTPVFDGFEINFNNTINGTRYGIQIRYGTASSTLDDINDNFSINWPSTYQITGFLTAPDTSGYERLPTSFNHLGNETDPCPMWDNNDLCIDVATSTTYYAKAYLFFSESGLNYQFDPDQLIASSTMISFSFNDNAPRQNYDYEEQETGIGNTYNSQGIGYNPYINCVLCNKAPFIYLYQLETIFGGLNQTNSNNAPTLSLDLTDTDFPFTLNVFSSTTLTTFAGSSAIGTMKTIITASIWLGLILYIYARIKSLLR